MSGPTPSSRPAKTAERLWRAAVLVVLLGLFSAPGLLPAQAAWTSSGTGTGAAQTGTLSAPTATATALQQASVQITWTPGAGLTPEGYYVVRTKAGVPSAACGSSPSSLLTGSGCTDTAVADGSYTYQVTAVFRSWTAVSASTASVTVATPAQLAISTVPSTITAGLPLSSVLSVSVLTAAGTPSPWSGIPVTLALSPGSPAGTLTGLVSASTNSAGVAAFPTTTVTTAGAGYGITASSTGLTSVASTLFSVTAAAPTVLAVSPATISQTAAATANSTAVTVSLKDVYGNAAVAPLGGVAIGVASTSTGTTIVSMTAGASATGSVTVPAGSGSAAFYYGDTKAGAATITVSATGMTGASVSSTTSAAAPAALAFSQPPTDTVRDGIINASTGGVIVRINDQFGNLTTSTATVTAALDSVPASRLSGTKVVAAVGGVATFSTLNIKQRASYTMTVTSPGLTSATSGPFAIT